MLLLILEAPTQSQIISSRYIHLYLCRVHTDESWLVNSRSTDTQLFCSPCMDLWVNSQGMQAVATLTVPTYPIASTVCRLCACYEHACLTSRSSSTPYFIRISRVLPVIHALEQTLFPGPFHTVHLLNIVKKCARIQPIITSIIMHV